MAVGKAYRKSLKEQLVLRGLIARPPERKLKAALAKRLPGRMGRPRKHLAKQPAEAAAIREALRVKYLLNKLSAKDVMEQVLSSRTSGAEFFHQQPEAEPLDLHLEAEPHEIG
eukprot:4056081-Amphidinium_carterae.2